MVRMVPASSKYTIPPFIPISFKRANLAVFGEVTPKHFCLRLNQKGLDKHKRLAKNTKYYYSALPLLSNYMYAMSETVGLSNHSPSSDMRSKSSTKASSKTRMTAEDLAAMRHLRSVIESITLDENMSPSERKRKVSDFNHSLIEAEQRLHYHANHLPNPLHVDPLMALSSPKIMSAKKNTRASVVGAVGSEKKKNKKKEGGWLRLVLLGKQDNSQTNVGDDGKKTSSNTRIGGVLETLDEVAEETRGDDSREKSPAVADDRDETDSIIELRMQNSDAFLASICSLRSLGTFEKDFINNIIADQEANGEARSVSTFEQDFMARMNNRDAITHPTQVLVSEGNPADDMDDLTVGTILSETTFENDARAIMNKCDGEDTMCSETTFENDARAIMNKFNGEVVSTLPLKLPIQVTSHSDIFDGIIEIDTLRSETTYDRNECKKQEFPDDGTLRNVGSAAAAFFVEFDERNMVKGTMSDDSQISVSTYEKDMAALNALAVKIGRKPSTRSKVILDGIMSTAGDRARSNTFEQDDPFFICMKGALRVNVESNGQVAMTEPTDLSVSTFEKDYLMRLVKPHTIICDRPPQLTEHISLIASPKTEPSTPQSTAAFENEMTKSPNVNLNLNPGWFYGIKASEVKRDNAGGGSGAVYVLSGDSAAIDRNRSGLSDAARLANAKADAMDTSKRLSKISPLEVQLSPVKLKEQEGSIWGRFCNFYL